MVFQAHDWSIECATIWNSRFGYSRPDMVATDGRTRVKVDVDVSGLKGVRETLLLTLWTKALDARRPWSILQDTHADALARRIDYNFDRLEVTTGLVINGAMRARHLDDAVRAYLKAFPNAQVIDIGCGLDARRTRVAPSPGVLWIDLDYPDVIALRRTLLGESPGSQLLGADLADPNWLGGIDPNRPTIISADGVLPFLKEAEAKAFFTGVVRHFRHCEVVFNGYSTMAARLMKKHKSMVALGASEGFGFDDPREPESWAPGLKLVGSLPLIQSPYARQLPFGWRMLFAMLAPSRMMQREGGRILRYRTSP
jgi:O-methyltransferase involved in polyketide biosynthesis